MSKHHTHEKAAAAEAGSETEFVQDQGDEALAHDAQTGAVTADAAAQSGGDSERAPAGGAETPEAEAAPGEKIAALEAEAAELRDQLLRKAADFENFRKRMNQEKQNAIEYANQSLLLDIIPIIDDFERAIQSAQASTELAALPAGQAMRDGISMIEKRLTGQLESKWGLKRFSSAGEPFDPNRHEALMMEKSPDVSEPTVQEDLIKGYLLKERVIRAAKVKVLMPDEEGSRE